MCKPCTHQFSLPYYTVCRWIDDIGGTIVQLAPLVEAARAQLRGDPGAGPQAVLRQMNEQLQQTGIPAIAQCEGCGMTAAGLRACSGCRAVQYCRWAPWELQYRGWEVKHVGLVSVGDISRCLPLLLMHYVVPCSPDHMRMPLADTSTLDPIRLCAAPSASGARGQPTRRRARRRRQLPRQQRQAAGDWQCEVTSHQC